MRLPIRSSLALLAVGVVLATAPSAHAQTAEATTDAFDVELHESRPMPFDAPPPRQTEVELGVIVSMTGLGLFIVGALLSPTAMILQGFVDDAFEPTIGTAIGLASVA